VMHGEGFGKVWGWVGWYLRAGVWSVGSFQWDRVNGKYVLVSLDVVSWLGRLC